MLRTHMKPLLMQVSSIALMAAVAATGQPASAFDETDGWISMNQALVNAQRHLPEATPFHVDLDIYVDEKFFEVKSFKNQTLYAVQIDPVTGEIVHTDSDTGPGAQAEIADAQFVLSQSMFTLDRAMMHVESLYPNYFITELAMVSRNGVPVMEVDLVRGRYRMEVRLSAPDGEVMKENLKLMSQASWYNDLFIPDTVPDWNLEGLRTPQQMITIAHNMFGGKVFFIEYKEKEFSSAPKYEVRLLNKQLVICATFNARWGTLISSKTMTNAEYAARVKTSVQTPKISLNQAMDVAHIMAPYSYCVESKLNTQSNGKYYQIECLTTGGILEFKIDSTTGAIMRMEFAD